MPEKQIKERIFGLDILRSIAILLVVYVHSKFLIEAQLPFLKSIYLPDGVDLFFVLSGFLIGSMLINGIENEKQFKFVDAMQFLVRRWFRTLPNYFLFLIINIILIYFGLTSGFINKYLVTFFLFVQNLYKPYDFLYWESWSLAVEEWFYLVFPFLLVLLFHFRKSMRYFKGNLLYVILILIFGPLLYRILTYNSSLDWDLYYRKLVLARLDSIGFGLLSSWMFYYYKIFWIKFKTHFFISGIGLMLLILNINQASDYFMKVIFFTIMPFFIALSLPMLNSIKKEKLPFKPFQFISKISYSMYLIHLPLLGIIRTKHLLYIDNMPFLVYLLFWITTIILSALVFRFFERPITKLRERISIT